jgi:hypothetical protein
MRQIFKIIMNQFEKSASNNLPLGRWNIDYCLKKTDAKIDLANEDHCGPCGQYNKNIVNVQHNKSIVDNNKYIMINQQRFNHTDNKPNSTKTN